MVQLMERVGLATNTSFFSEKEASRNYSPFLHLHAYQPPRILNIEGNTIFDIAGGPDGYNEKVWRESYYPILSTGILDNGYIGFNIYGSLRDWIKQKHPDTWEGFKKTIQDKKDMVLGDPYLHPIFPLLPDRDKGLLLRIGLEACYQDYGFYPSGFWLPETAVDKDTLDTLSDAGVGFLLLRKDQLLSDFDSQAYSVRTRSGQIIVLPFDPSLSGSMAFGDISDAYNFAERVASEVKQKALAAVDWETFGHHRGPGSVEFLRHLTNRALPTKGLDFSQGRGTASPATVKDNSSWSCPHFLGRWTGGCDCDGANSQTRELKQTLYTGLREKLDEVNMDLDVVSGGTDWEKKFKEWFLSQRANLSGGTSISLSQIEKRYKEGFRKKLIILVGLTSCGWFFGNEGGIERSIPKNALEEVA